MFLSGSWSYGVKGRKVKVRLRVGLEWSGLDHYRHFLPGIPQTRTNSGEGGWTQHLWLLVVYPQVPTLLYFFFLSPISSSFPFILLSSLHLFYLILPCSGLWVRKAYAPSSAHLSSSPDLPSRPPLPASRLQTAVFSHLWSRPSPFCVLEPESWLPWNWN